ncbi:MAG: site-specific integrase [Opitutus sp.]|nr:site-specific integrase [Opitutus sp.]
MLRCDHACFTDHDGIQKQRSTGVVDRDDANRIALSFEDAYRRKMTEQQVRRVLNDVCEAINGRRFATATVSEFLGRWLTRKQGETTESTATRYGEAIRRFESFIGPERCAQEVCRLGVSDFARLRDHLAKTVTAGTTNLVLKIVSSAMKAAWMEGLITENPAAKVERLKLKKSDEARRRPFTLDELRLILAHATDEWRGIILCGVYTGQRLGDIVRLRWRNVDLLREEVRLETQKTGRTVIIPLAKPLLAHFLTLPSGDDNSTPVFPQAFGIVEREGRVNNLSNQFYELLVDAGLADERSAAKQKEGDGRDVKRRQRGLVFHSLRHTATSLLKNAGVSEMVAMDIIGHDSPAISQNYTHVDEDAKRRAMALVPDITVAEKKPKASAKAKRTRRQE